MASQDRIRLITTILNLYYVEQLTQTEIAERLNLSVPKVNRLLLQARELGYIEFVIRTPLQHLFELENSPENRLWITGSHCHSKRGEFEHFGLECRRERSGQLFVGTYP